MRLNNSFTNNDINTTRILLYLQVICLPRDTDLEISSFTKTDKVLNWTL